MPGLVSVLSTPGKATHPITTGSQRPGTAVLAGEGAGTTNGTESD